MSLYDIRFSVRKVKKLRIATRYQIMASFIQLGIKN
jgi:hypothetical protein